MATLREILNKNYKFEVTREHCRKLNDIVTRYETNPNHAKALGTALLGVDRMYFHPTDKDALFHLFNIESREFSQDVFSSENVDRNGDSTSKKVEFVGNVATEPFNILTVWCAHRARNSKLSVSDVERFCYLLYKYMLFSFFTSIVNHHLPNGADAPTMMYTIEQLNLKSSIKHTKTWLTEIELAALATRDSKSQQKKYEKAFDPGIEVARTITYIRNNLAKKLLRVTRAYYLNKEAGNSMMTDSMMQTIGEDVSLRAIESSIPGMCIGVSNSATNLGTFLDYEYIEITAASTNEIQSGHITNMLTKFSSMAEMQKRKGEGESIQSTRTHEQYIGYRKLITEIIKTVYRECLIDGSVNATRKVEILDKVKVIFTASRVKDVKILNVKESVDRVISTLLGVKRESTVTAYRSAFITYIVLLSFKYL